MEQIAERVLLLKGEVELVASSETQKIHDVREMLVLASQMEESCIQDYQHWANECSTNADSTSKKLFEVLVEDEERHFDQFDTEMENIDKLGEQYLALQSIERSKSMSDSVPAE